MKLKSRFFLIPLLFLASCVEDPETYPNTWDGNFEALWNIMDTRYCYLDYKQINWDSVYVVYREKIETVSDEYELFEVLSEMLSELKDGHVNLYSDFNKSRYWAWFEDYPSNFDASLIYQPRYLGEDYRIAGGMHYQKINGGNVGYVYYESFSSVFTSANLNRMFEYFSDCQGLIFDVRNNGGGYLNQAERLASCFFDERTLTGYMSHKTGDGHSDFSEPVAIYTTTNDSLHWSKPVIVLTNRMSFSATNTFVCRMRYAPRATIVGDKTGGGGGLPMSTELPNGWSVRFSASPMFDAEMQHIEWGLDPDIPVSLNSLDGMSGYDTLIERAIAILRAD